MSKIIKVTCRGAASVPVGELEEFQGSLKTLSREQAVKIRESIQRYGFSFPIFAWEDRHGKKKIIDGHQRLHVLREMLAEGWELDGGAAPVAWIDAKSEREAKEKILLAASVYARVSEEGIKLFLEEADINLDEIRLFVDIPEIDIEDIRLGDDGDEIPGEEDESFTFAGFGQEQVFEFVKDDFRAFDPEGWEKRLISPSTAAFQFNALCKGRDTGYYISALFNPHRLQVPVNRKKSVYECFRDKNETFIKDGARYMTDYYGGRIHPSHYPKYCGVGWSGVAMAFEFRPAIARDIVKRYLPAGGRILDPCHGWGGRLVGTMATLLPVEYVGFDPGPETHEGLKKLIAFIMGAEGVKNAGSSACVECAAYEDAEPEGLFDFAFTSPPYFDTEDYTEAEDSVGKRYRTYAGFEEGFFKPLIVKTMEHLKQGAKFVINIGVNRYPMDESLRKICAERGFKAERIEGFGIGGSGIGKRSDYDGDGQGEPFFEITK